jgi:predicted DNA-binding transcriptional regulator YafY
MKRSKSQFSRLLELDRRIRSETFPNCLTFAEEWEVSQKTVQRDVDFLRDQLGAPIEYDRDKKGFYYADQNWFLPALSMSEGDLFALLIGTKALEAYRGTPVAKELEQVFNKIAALLPDKLSIRPELVFSRFSFTAPPAKPIDPKIWTCVVRGLMNQTVVRVTYRGLQAKEDKEHLLMPYHIANLQGEWYVLGCYEDEKDVRQFSFARIRKAALTDKRFDMPPDFDPAKLLSKTFGRFVGGGTVHNVRLLFDKEIADWVTEKVWHPKQKIVKRRNGDIELQFRVTGLYEVFRWVLAWGHNVKVLEPKELKKWVKDEVGLMTKIHVDS